MRFVWVRVEYPGIGTDCCCSHRRGCCGRLIPPLQSNCCGRHSDGAYSLLLSSLLPILIPSNLPYATSHQVVYPSVLLASDSGSRPGTAHGILLVVHPKRRSLCGSSSWRLVFADVTDRDAAVLRFTSSVVGTSSVLSQAVCIAHRLARAVISNCYLKG
jgi:hypothetical protein